MARLFATVFDKIDRLNAIHDAYGKHDFYNQLELATDRSSLNALAQQVDGIQLRVSIIGEFSSGKSTFINAILRKDILPAAYRPTTNQVMQIEHDNETESVVIENQPNSARPLTKEAISTLAKESDTRLLIRTRIPTPMDRFTLFDTPGVNDPAMLSEEVIFDLLGESDIIVFLMRADNALKQTETEFIKKLVLKKDLDKFFFVINFSDNLTNPNEAKELKAYVVRGIANLVEWPRAQIEGRVFMYSAKESLVCGIQGAEQEDAWKRHTHLVNMITDFATKRREDLESAAVLSEMTRCLQPTFDKLTMALDLATDMQQNNQQQLICIDSDIHAFRGEVQVRMDELRGDLRKQLRILVDGLNSSFEEIKRETLEAVANMSDNDLEQSDLIQKLIRKQVEDAVEQNTKKLWKALDNISSQVDKDISPALDKTLKKISGYHKGFDSSSLIAASGATALGYVAATTILPWVFGSIGLLGTAGIALAIYNPPIGGAFLGAAKAGFSGLTGLLSVGVKGAMLSYQGIKDPLAKTMGSRDKAKYGRELAGHIDEIKRTIITDIESSLNVDTMVQGYIESKFPQKAEIEQRQLTDRNRTVNDRKVLDAEREYIVAMRDDMLKLFKKQNLIGVKS